VEVRTLSLFYFLVLRVLLLLDNPRSVLLVSISCCCNEVQAQPKQRQIFVICGISGTGKTHYRRTHNYLRHLQCIDTADIYEEFPGEKQRG
jgi:hypothetical protein